MKDFGFRSGIVKLPYNPRTILDCIRLWVLWSFIIISIANILDIKGFIKVYNNAIEY